MRYEDISNHLIACLILSAEAVLCFAYVIKKKGVLKDLPGLQQ